MRLGRFLAIAALIPTIFLPALAQSQQTQSVLFLQKALAALSGGVPTKDVTFSGTARYIVGSNDETGSVVLKGIPGASRMDLTLPSGPRSEVMNVLQRPPSGFWSGPDGVSHAISHHNLRLIDPAWFFSLFVISRGLSPGHNVTYVGHATHNDQSVEHVSLVPQITNPKQDVVLFQHLGQVDLYLDSTTFLPLSMSYNTHPDNNALLDIPIEVRFSDYRSVNGLRLPFRIQKFLNNGLVLDLQFQTVTFNTDAAVTDFSIQ
jgi:hypothetical protein